MLLYKATTYFIMSLLFMVNYNNASFREKRKTKLYRKDFQRCKFLARIYEKYIIYLWTLKGINMIPRRTTRVHVRATVSVLFSDLSS